MYSSKIAKGYQSVNCSFTVPEKPKSFTELAPGALKVGTPSDFLTFIVAKHQKLEGGYFGKSFFSEKVSQCRNN